MSVGYVESSALTAWALGEPSGGLVSRHLRRLTQPFACSLLRVETVRAVSRALTDGRISAAGAVTIRRRVARFIDSCDLVVVDEALFARASDPFPVEPVRTLDAIHLAAIERAAKAHPSLVVIATDSRVRANAMAWGLAVRP